MKNLNSILNEVDEMSNKLEKLLAASRVLKNIIRKKKLNRILKNTIDEKD